MARRAMSDCFAALQNAVSIAGLLLTTDCLVTEKPGDKDAGGMPGGMPGGGMPGGMGGMGGMPGMGGMGGMM